MKVVVNRCYGSFGLSHEAVMRYSELAGLNLVGVQDSLFYHYYRDGKIGDEDYYWSEGDLERTDPLLIQVVEELGEKADGSFSTLEVVEIPDDVKWKIAEYDGWESVQEVHRSW